MTEAKQWTSAKRWFQRLVVVMMVVGMIMGKGVEVRGAEPLETSIVSLVIRSGDQILEHDYFFELLDQGDYLLLPIGSLASRLSVTMDFQRQAGLLELKSLLTGKIVQINLEEQVYLEHEDWSQEPPLMYQGDFYLTPRLLEYLTGVTIEWNSKLQELTISGVGSGELQSSQMAQGDVDQVGEMEPGGQRAGLEKQAPQLVEDDISLSSIQYQVQVEVRQKGNDPFRVTKAEDLGVYGRLWGWSISLGGRKSQVAATEEVSYQLTKVLAQTQTDTYQLILGDTKVDLDETIGQQKIRGVVYQDQLLQKKREELRPLEEGTRQGLWVMGLCRGTADQDWTGELMGFDLAQGVKENLTVDWQLAVNRSLDSQGIGKSGLDGVQLGSKLGLVAKWPWPIVTTADWLVGGDGQKLEQGGKGSLRYTFGSGYVEGAYTYIPPRLTATLQESAGKKFRAVTEWGVDQLLLRFQGEVDRSGWEMEPEGKELAQFSIAHQPDPWQVTTLTGNVGRSTFEIPQPDATGEEEQQRQQVQLKEGGIHLDYRREAIETSLQGGIAFTAGRLFSEQELLYDLQRFELEGGFYRKLGGWALGSNVEYTGANQEEGLENDLELETMAKWSEGNHLYLSSSGKLHGARNPKWNETFAISELEWDLRLQKYISSQTSVLLEGQIAKLPFLEKAYTKYAASLTHRSADDTNDVVMTVGYVSPIAKREIPQWTWSMNGTLYLEHEVELTLQVQRNFSTLYEVEAEEIYTISLKHGFGLAGGKWVGQCYTDEAQPQPYIGGLVYLDQNGNGQMDGGEPTLERIQMFLDGRRAVSDRDGVFRFEGIRPGVYEIGFDLNSLVADYSIVTGNKLVQVRENENLFLNFGLTMNGSLAGQVFVDKNANGRREPDEEPLLWVGIELVESGDKTFSRQDGTYYFDNIPLGQYTLRVLEDSLPAGMRVGAGVRLNIDMNEVQLDLHDVNIPIIYGF